MKCVCRRGQFNFVWIFAILSGGAILALAIWGALQAGDTLRFQSDTEAAKSISILTNPLQSGFAEGSFGKISFRQTTRINNICLDYKFGTNDISVAMKSGVGSEWNLAGSATSIHNKYIFSEKRNEGFDFFVFSKSFDFPYEVSDLIFLSSNNYCFLNAPDEIRDEVLGLRIDNIALDNCSFDGERICFGGGLDCDAIIYGSCMNGCDSIYDEGVVSKDGEDLYYVGNLMYGAIFGDKDVYECNVRRLLYRASNIADVLAEKSDLMNARNCGTNLKGDLIAWVEMLKDKGSDDLIFLNELAEDMERKNREVCGMW